MSRMPNTMNRYLLHPLQAAGAVFAFTLFRILPLSAASAVGGAVARWLGPHLSVSRRAVRNLSKAFPDKSDAEISAIVYGMWDNLGRTAAEYPHLGRIDIYDPDGPVEVVGREHVDLLRDDEAPGIFFSGHIANWEIISLGATQRGVPLDRIYRAPNNRLVEWLFQYGRSAVDGALVPKGSQGARLLLKSMRDGKHLGMLVDQKMNDGIPVPFFGRDAMTAPALGELAIRYRCPVVPARVERLGGARFRLTVLPPMELPDSGDRRADVTALMAQVNSQIEAWIRETPEQWLWLHNRWAD